MEVLAPAPSAGRATSMPPTTFDFPPLPIGPGVTAVQLFESAAAQSAEDGSEPRARRPEGRSITSLQSRLLDPSGPKVRLGRYEVRRCIGSGGMGVVFEAVSLEHGQRVALKTLRALTGPGLHRFKNEFRSLSGVVHENLVALHELAVEGREWFFTMEYVEGASFLEHVQSLGAPRAPVYLGETLRVDETAPPSLEAPLRAEAPRVGEGLAYPTFHEGRLRAALRGLAAGVAALHELGKLHRDLNSANVLVTPEGRVVILDFGLITGGSRHRPSADGAADGISGTPGFMSPEQAAGKPATPASDWYGVGVMLFEALTGQLPFRGSLMRMLRNKQREDAPRPSTLVAGVPADLEELCAALLDRRPEQRPRAEDVLRRLGVEKSRVFARGGAADGRLVGRRDELGVLEGAYRAAGAGTPARVLVQGPAGIGKTALVGCFVEGLVEREGAVVLRGACCAREAIPHRAVDALVDALALHLRTLPKAEARALLPPSARDLVRLFPVLEGVAVIADLPARSRPLDDAEELERTAFAALAEVLGRLSRARPLVLWIDDVAEGTPGEARRLASLVAPAREPGARAPLIVFGCAPEGASALVAALGGADGLRRIELGPLPPADTLSLARHALLRSGTAPEAAELLARASEGNPALVDELAQWIAADPVAALADGVSFERLVAVRLERLPDAARRLVEVLAAVGAPLSLAVALAVARVEAHADATVLLLTASRLARARGIHASDAIEVHDLRLGAAVAARLPAAARRAILVDVARALAAQPGFDAELVADCYHRGGDLDAATAHAASAARRAVEARDFDRAALLCDHALGWNPSPAAARALVIRRAAALADAGRGAEAGRGFLVAAAGALPDEALDLRRRAAEHLLVGGRVDEGLAVLRPVLDAHGIDYPETPRRALLALLSRLLLLRLRGTALSLPAGRPGSPGEAGRIDAAWSAGKGLSASDPMRSAVFMVEALLAALASGDVDRTARGLAFVGCLLAYEGGAPQEEHGHELIEEASRIARRTGDPYLMALTWGSGGVARLCAGRWREALARLDEGLALLEPRCTGVTWERNVYRTLGLQALFALGALRERTRRAEAWLVEARSRGDLHGEVEAALAAALGRLAAGEAAAARLEARRAAAQAWRGSFAFQHQAALWLETSSYLHEGRAAAAWERLAEGWPALDASQLLRIQRVRIDAVLLRGVTAEALSAVRRARSDELLRRADADASSLGRERRPHARAAASLVRAGTSRVRGDLPRALEHLRAAARGYEAIEMSLHAACARRAAGVLLGGAEGAALIRRADVVLRGEGIVEPARWAQMYTGLLR